MNTPETNASAAALAPARAKPLLDKKGNIYQPAIGPRLKILLALIFATFAVLGATAAYLVAIRLLNLIRAPKDYTNYFYMWMFLVHVAVGVVITVPFFIFGFSHYASARHRKNRLAVRLGVSLFITGIVVVLTGLALSQDLVPGLPKLPTETLLRVVVLWLHSLAPLAAVALYVLHRRAGPDIKWSWGIGWGAMVGAFVVFMLYMHSQQPQKWYAVGPKEGADKYFFPSDLRTADGKLIPAKTLMMDEYCKKCHQDIYNDHLHSAHKFSSFNNPAYLFSVRNTRKHAGIKASRWCAGCHDTVPFLSGAFDKEDFDDVNDPTAHAGITCTVCHAVTNIDSTKGNASFTIDAPPHYPFASSDDPFLQWVNNQLVKAKPDFHKKTFLKPFHKSAEFCATCHKVSLPLALNNYKEWTRGQNHYDTYLLSGVSGVGARSFYYPPRAITNCAGCHMPPKESDDFGSKVLDSSGKRKVHNHLFPAANTGLPWLLSHELKLKRDPRELERAMKVHADFLRDNKLRIDLFGLKVGHTPDEDGTIKGKLIAPLRPQLPELESGRTYLVEVVIRTVSMGHPFPQGTADSNEIWVDFTASSGGKVFGRSGALKDEKRQEGEVDKWSHFLNIYLLNRNGERISRRNPEDIVIPLYDHQIPPGAGQVVHYKLKVPKWVKEPVKLNVKLRYRKFDHDYMRQVYAPGSKIPGQRELGKNRLPRLPIVDMCQDEVKLPVRGMKDADRVMKALKDQPLTIPVEFRWQRWNDYGIGCLLEGAPGGNKFEGKGQSGELDQAEKAFAQLARDYAGNPVAHGNGLINLARTYNDAGQLQKAVGALNKVIALNRAHKDKPPIPWWTVAWVSGQVSARQRHFDDAIKSFEQILDPKNKPRQRNFDFTRDYIVINALGKALFDRAQDNQAPAERIRLLRRAVEQYEHTLQLDAENADAHLGLMRCYRGLADSKPAVDAGEVPTANSQHLLALGKTVADGKAARTERLRAAAQLEQAVQDYSSQETQPNKPKVPVLALLRRQCREVFEEEKDAGLRAAAAQALGSIHSAFHLIYKPDDEAEAIKGKARERPENKAAARAADPVPLYPLFDPGAAKK